MGSLRGIRHERALLRWRWVWVPLVGLTAAAIAINALPFGRTTSMAIGVAAMAIPLVLAQRRRTAVIGRVRATGGCCCTRCGYGLASLGDEGVCPECGEPFTLDATREAWNAAFPCWHPELGRKRKARS